MAYAPSNVGRGGCCCYFVVAVLQGTDALTLSLASNNADLPLCLFLWVYSYYL